MLAQITRLYRAYNYYASPDKFLVRSALRELLDSRRQYRKALEVGAGIATLTQLVKSHAQIETYITSDVDESDTADVVCDAQDMPFEDQSFDLIISFEVMEHIPDPEAFISETARVLTAEGDVLFTLPFIYGRHDFQDFHRWTEKGLHQIFERHGLAIKALRKRGGTGLAMSRLFVNYVHDSVASRQRQWRTKSSHTKLLQALMTLTLVPVNMISWLAMFWDKIFDRDSANPLGFVILAHKPKALKASSEARPYAARV
jgi:ubiquinone/menaquinone biosynthesis C-methylase UbiE